MKKRLIVGMSAILLSVLAGAADMLTTTTIEKEAGSLARQLLDYDWEAENDAVIVPTNALASFRFFTSNAVAKAYAPPETAKISFHRRTEKTCDAIRMIYEKDGLVFTVFQTRLTMLLVVKGAATVSPDLKKADASANRLAQRVLGWPEYPPLVITSATDQLSVGRPKKYDSNAKGKLDIEVPAKGKSKGGFIFDCWWANGEELAFFGAKEPSDAEGVIIIIDNMKSVKRNHRWF